MTCHECGVETHGGELLCEDCSTLSRASNEEDLRIAAARDDFDDPPSVAAASTRSDHSLIIGVVATGLVLSLAGVLLVLLRHESLSAGSLATNTAQAMGTSCTVATPLSSDRTNPSAYPHENPAQRSKVTETSVCVGRNVVITAVTLKGGADPNGEFTSSMSTLNVFEYISGDNWVVAILALGLSRSAAHQHPLANVARAMSATTWSTGNNSNETNCSGWITDATGCN
jgi:hypothetical protein